MAYHTKSERHIEANENPKDNENLKDNDIAAESGKPFRLLDLPPELRNRVYIHALNVSTTNGKVKISKPREPFDDSDSDSDSDSGSEDGGPRPDSVLALLQTNRQVHSEAQGLFYSLNHFRINAEDLEIIHAKHPADSCREGRGFLSQTGKERVGCIKSLTLVVGVKVTFHRLLEQLEFMPSLETLCLELDCPAVRDVEEVVEGEMEKVRGYLREAEKLREVCVVGQKDCDGCGERSGKLKETLQAAVVERDGKGGEEAGD